MSHFDFNVSCMLLVVIRNRNIKGGHNVRNFKKNVIGSKTSRDLKGRLILLLGYDFVHRGGRFLCLIFDIELKIPPSFWNNN